MARLGMDVDVVEGLGRQLKSQAQQIQSVISQIENLVNQAVSSWDGKDSQDFHQWCCLLYTSDAADERSSVDLGGRRIIKKTNKKQPCLSVFVCQACKTERMSQRRQSKSRA